MNEEIYNGTTEDIANHLESELADNSDLYFFCLRRNSTFLDELKLLKNDFNFFEPYLHQFMPIKKRIPLKYTNSFLAKDALTCNFKNILAPTYNFKNILALSEQNTDTECIERLNCFSNSYKIFSFKWKVIPPLYLERPFEFIDQILDLDFDKNSSYIDLDDQIFFISKNVSIHALDTDIFINKLSDFKIKKSKPNLENILHSLRAYKINEDFYFKRWPSRDKIQTLLFEVSISSYNSESYSSRLSKLKDKAEEYISNPFIVLKAIT